MKTLLQATDKKPEVKIDWRIYTKDPNKPLIRDLIVEGLKLARTQKEEFSSILSSNNNDINALFFKIRGIYKSIKMIWYIVISLWIVGMMAD